MLQPVTFFYQAMHITFRKRAIFTKTYGGGITIYAFIIIKPGWGYDVENNNLAKIN